MQTVTVFTEIGWFTIELDPGDAWVKEAACESNGLEGLRRPRYRREIQRAALLGVEGCRSARQAFVIVSSHPSACNSLGLRSPYGE